jgi:hypothetical protein
MQAAECLHTYTKLVVYLIESWERERVYIMKKQDAHYESYESTFQGAFLLRLG